MGISTSSMTTITDVLASLGFRFLISDERYLETVCGNARLLSMFDIQRQRIAVARTLASSFGIWEGPAAVGGRAGSRWMILSPVSEMKRQKKSTVTISPM